MLSYAVPSSSALHSGIRQLRTIKVEMRSWLESGLPRLAIGIRSLWLPSAVSEYVSPFTILARHSAEHTQVLTDGEVDNSPEHINEYIEGTIKRLGSTPDLYYLHRIDPKQDLKESITALDQLKKDGKIKYIGLSECNAQTLRKACSCMSFLCFW
jgi:hypothetical protein